MPHFGGRVNEKADMTQTHESHYIRRALQLARRGQGRVEPNPMVGAVLVRDGRIIGEGYHARFGGPHAEIVAIRDGRRRGQEVAGSDLYVTLEPCCHVGKTPPCTQAVIDAGIARVFVAMEDPDPRMRGGGLAQLRQAGIEVHIGLGESKARSLNEPFIKRTVVGLPWVIAKWAQTLDGRVATRTGDSKWISSDRSRQFVHRLRSRVDAVMVGIGTVLADDPRLTARHVKPKRPARRVVVDPDVKLPATARLLREAGPGLTLAVRQGLLAEPSPRVLELAEAGVELVGLPEDSADGSRLLLRPLLEHLATGREATNVLVEGGPRLLGALLREGLVDQVLAFVAPRLLGDTEARAAVEGLHRPRIAEATGLRLTGLRRVGEDVLLDYRVSYPQE